MRGAMVQQPRKGAIYKPGLKFFLVFGGDKQKEGGKLVISF